MSKAPKSKIYTKKGDTGYSSTIDRKNIKKSEKVFELLGDLDELNSFIGFVQQTKSPFLKKDISSIQAHLFTFGALIAGAKIIDAKSKTQLIDSLSWLESRIDFYDSKNLPIKNFILPSGIPQANYAFLARAVCRRIERQLVRNSSSLPHQQKKEIMSYINRLSDFLFVVARYINKSSKIKEFIW
jgi:cob(I)alamin adenosyltransferase